jgi:hypothetical protein
VLFALLLLLLCVSASAPRAEPSLAISDPQRLLDIEGEGFTFAGIVLGSAESDNAALYRQPAYRAIADSLAEDLRRLASADAQLGITMRAPHRLFDAAWLRSAAAHFELVGIINRMDRAAFSPGSCGELRFIYRLAYRKEQAGGSIYSRLPMTVNVVFLLDQRGDRCRTGARQWLQGADLKVIAGAVDRQHLKSVEVNVQAVRWPSTVRPDMGGYAEYLLRVFRRSGERFEPVELENTPDADRLLATPALRQQLVQWLRQPENFRAVDDGIARLPDAFLARKVTSVSLHGAHRLANMPFTQILGEDELADLAYASGRFVRSPHGLLRRLNDLSCSGCHQGRTVAGFHFLGVDRDETDAVNAIALGASPHFLGDQPRRLAYVAALADGAPPMTARPLSLRADGEEGGFGSHCGLGDASFATWTCRPSLRCVPVTADERVSRTGECVPQTPLAGAACRPGRIVPDRDPHRDRLLPGSAASCGARAVCEAPAVGFPGGMCSHACGELQPGETCGAIAILEGFNACLAAGTAFAVCLRGNVRPAALKACGTADPCRDDFVCARTAQGVGACIPPYFLFQLRLDGHPAP